LQLKVRHGEETCFFSETFQVSGRKILRVHLQLFLGLV